MPKLINHTLFAYLQRHLDTFCVPLVFFCGLSLVCSHKVYVVVTFTLSLGPVIGQKISLVLVA